MDYKKHIAVSVPPSVFIFYKFGIIEGVLFFLSSFLIDIDHVFDYVLLNKRKFKIKEFFEACENGELDKVLLFFHSIEILILGIVIFWNSIYVFLFLGALYHVIFDSFTNLLNPFGYFLIYRVYVGLKRERFIRK